MSNKKRQGAFYTGSRLLNPLSDITGLPIDQVNFLACQLFGIALSIPFRKLLDPRTTNPKVRHAVELVVGLAMAYFCFQYHILHVIVQSGTCYLILLFGPARWMPTLVSILAITYLSVCHIYRMIYDYGGYTLDITGPLMITTQKVTSLAFALYDGTSRDEKKLTDDQKSQMIKKCPDLLTFWSYIFYFHGFMSGPLAFFSDYIDFIDGSNFRGRKGQDDAQTTSEAREPPNPMPTVARKVGESAVFGVLMLCQPIFCPWEFILTEEFYTSYNFFQRLMYTLITMSMCRPKYYLAWRLADAVNNAAGLGYRKSNEMLKEDWDLLNNIDIIKLETCDSLKLNIDSWNKQTSLWLRRIIYDRAPESFRVHLVFLISAFWHGFYPGYYLTFATGMLFTLAARQVRRNIRPLFIGQDQRTQKFLYDCVTFIFTRLANIYMVAPFVLLDIWSGLRVYTSLFWFMHIGAIAIIIYYTFVKPPRRDKGAKGQ
ncbi:hypothetical protein ACJMK2_001763 [Sinanodonta woodiana]|uniref:Lysophospholipid acyltransferase 2 n=1 Tax=Sinanodonta woodiana TaxID=1069815 RepID=A0ABD3XT64_SINWO